ncbi:MAG: keto-deoxy-phosphogluconate aldolase [Desulfocapsa sp.]|nr:MAG: keto-deoxy-phosphogluconate aldolase [Desulfocapsa sp.]
MKFTALEILQTGPVVPVMVIEDVEHAVPLAKALVSGGVRVLEITLRSDAALESIRRISEQVPDAIVGAGTVTSAKDLEDITAAGAVFAISPGLTPKLLKAAAQSSIHLIPGISSASELMYGMEAGLSEFKFFPAEAAGGIQMIKSLGGPFPYITFCPTGGISPANYRDYLALKNVACVGGSWLAPKNDVLNGDWQAITTLCKDATT